MLYTTEVTYVEAELTAAGFEPTRAEPNGFRVHLLNHSDTLPLFKLQS